MPEYSRYQKGVIKRHYANLESKTLDALQEIVSELYLATDGAKQKRLWDRARQHLGKTDVPASRVETICEARDLKGLAEAIAKAGVPDRKPGPKTT